MITLQIVGIVALVVAALLAIIVWTIAYIEYRKVRKQERINWLLDRIRERAEDSGNESEGDTEELAGLEEMGYLVLGDVDNL
uniref:Protein Vpu n=1 Tax=Human immunodeficiency virus type 1 TaxID=11676 RepID=A0A6C0N286_HV1|nr:vpu protein [Human immunodeficiency virus 1]